MSFRHNTIIESWATTIKIVMHHPWTITIAKMEAMRIDAELTRDIIPSIINAFHV